MQFASATLSVSLTSNPLKDNYETVLRTETEPKYFGAW